MAGKVQPTNEKTELIQYLQSMDLDDLEMVNKERKSTKKLIGGPMIQGQ